jgi:hypothetical protein
MNLKMAQKAAIVTLAWQINTVQECQNIWHMGLIISKDVVQICLKNGMYKVIHYEMTVPGYNVIM